MANYRLAIDGVLSDEGVTSTSMGYVDDPNDRGGETLAGITRKNFPKSKVWPIVDAAKKLPNFPRNLVGNAELKEAIIDFYKEHFWDKVGGDKINIQIIADQLLNTAVLEGIVPAVQRAQNIVNLPMNGIFSDALATKLNNLA